MGFDDALNKAKDAAGDHPDQVNQGIDAAAKKGQDVAPDQVDSHIDKGSDLAKDHLGTNNDKQQG